MSHLPRRVGRAPSAALILLSAVMFLFAAGGCGHEDRNRAGFGLLPPSISEGAGATDTTLVGTFFNGAYHEVDYQRTSSTVSAGGSARLVVADSLGQRARALVHFQTPPLDTEVFRSAWIDLNVARLDTTVARPRVVAYELVEPFAEGTNGTAPFPLYLPTPLAEGRFIPARGDTEASYRFGGSGAAPADSAAMSELFLNWIRAARPDVGLAFAVLPGTSGRIEFTSREGTLLLSVQETPIAHVTYRLSGASTDSTGTALTDRDVFLADREGASIARLPGYLTAAGGVPARSLLKFDLPDAMHGRVMHRVLLKLTVDSTRTMADTLVAVAEGVTDSLWDSAPTPATWEANGVAVGTTGAVTSTLDTSSGKAVLVFEITAIARQWALGPAQNRGISIRAYDEFGNMSWIRFYDSTAPEALRPRLEIISSSIPGGT